MIPRQFVSEELDASAGSISAESISVATDSPLHRPRPRLTPPGFHANFFAAEEASGGAGGTVYDPASLKIEAKVGQGAFCEVLTVASKELGYGKAVMKRVRSDARKDTLEVAQKDLCHEAALLLAMQPHDHIIRLLGRHVVDGGRVDFLILEMLVEMFPLRYVQWQRRAGRQIASLPTAEFAAGFLCCFRYVSANWYRLWAERFAAGRDLALALNHLHTAALDHISIAYRDLKPQNIGFNHDGRLVLFDFGLAKCLPRTGDIESLLLSAETGSPRYMAPEVGLGEVYDHRCDMYSFSVLLWQFFALEAPYASMTTTKLHRDVFRGGKRPRIPDDWPGPLKDLLVRAWGRDVQRRPNAEDAAKILDKLAANFTLRASSE